MPEVPPQQLAKQNGPIADFLSDMKPFFYKRPVIYVDVGAHHGETFEVLRASGLSVNRALLFEANPTNFDVLRASMRPEEDERKFMCLNTALSDTSGEVQLLNMDDMSRVVSKNTDSSENAAIKMHSVPASTLDSFSDLLPDGHISILKIDVEGHEAAVLRGAQRMLSTQSVDVIYIEAGLNPENPQQTYYRDIEDILKHHGYHLFRIYEQTHEWIEDSPVLRRFNMAFISSTLAKRYPRSLTQELIRLETQLKEVAGQLEIAKAAQQSLSKKLDKEAVSYREQQDRNNEIQEYKTELAERFEEIAVLTRLCEEKDKTLAQRKREIAALRNSTSWRLTAPIRWVAIKLRR